MFRDTKKDGNLAPEADNEAQPLNQQNQDQSSNIPGGIQQPDLIQQNERKKTSALQASVHRSILLLKFLISLNMLIDVIYAWILCGLTQACLFNGIESPAWMSRTVLLFMAITFIILVLGYKFVSVLDKEWIRILKLFLFLWGILLIIFAILSFILLSGGGSLDQKQVISQLSEIAQLYYTTACDSGTPQECLDSKYGRNSLLIAIFHLVNGVLIFLIFALLINMDIPESFRPISTSRKQGLEKTFIRIDKRYSNLNKQLPSGEAEQKQIGDKDGSQFQQDEGKHHQIEGFPMSEPFRHHQKPY